MTSRERIGAPAGFTLVELLVVLAVAGLIVALANPMYSAVVPGTKLRADAHALVVSLRESASRAISNGHEIAVHFSPEESRYAVADGRPVELSRDTVLEVNTSLSASARLESYSERIAVVRFFPDGSSSGAAITLRGKRRAYQITVDWLTSNVGVAELDHEQI